MLASQQQSASNGANAQDPVQTDSECQWPRGFDPLFDELPSGGPEGAGPPGHINGGFDISSFNTSWSLAPSMAGQPAYPSPQINFGVLQPPSMNQGFNSLHTATQQHQWNLGSHLLPRNPPLNDFGLPKLFDPTGFSNAANHGQQNQFSGAPGNNQSGVPLFPQSATHEPQGISSQPSSGASVDRTRMSPTNSQAPQARLPTPAPAPDEPNLGHDEGNVPMPGWINLVKPTPLMGENVITLRRDIHVALDIILDRLPRQPPGGCSGIKVPATASVRNYADPIGKYPLEFRIHVNGATNKRRFETVCANCGKREGKRKGTPSFIDFCAPQDIIEQKDGRVRVEFIFCCYPKCHQDNGYFLDVVLSEDVNQNNIVAQHRLPFTFNVVAKLKFPQGQKRTRHQIEEPPVVDQRNVRPRRVPQIDADDERTDHPMPAVNPRSAPQGGQYREVDASSVSPPPVSPPQSSRNAAPNPGQHSTWKPPPLAIVPPSTEEEPTPTLTEVNPESGSITGGARIWLTGMELPTGFKLFARFGTAVVPTTVTAANLLACNLPPAATPGVVNVTLSKHPQQNAPEYGTSIARFQYIGDHDQLIPIVLCIQGQGYPEFSPVLQALLTSLRGHQPNHSLQGGSHGTGPRDDPIEISLIEALSCLQARPNFHEIVSTANDYHQTLAHLAILYDYPSLLGRLAEWPIDLTIADVNGLTALHCAYMKGDLDSVRILRRGGASETATDKLGRTPSELLPEGLDGFDRDIDLEEGYDAGLDAAEEYPEADDIDEQLALCERFSALGLDDDNGLLPPHPSHTTSLDTSHLSTDLTVRLLKPRPTQGGAVVLSRIETNVYLDIILPSRSWDAIRLPSTKSVTNDELSSIGEPTIPLLLAVVVRGATTRQEYHSICEQCKKRVGNKTGPAGMIDFHSPTSILTPERGIVQVHFTFSCYSRHHRKEDEQYVLEVILKNVSNPSNPRVVSRKELPYSFDVRSSRPRVKEPTSDQTQQANIGPSSNIRRGTGHVSSIG